ncbi:UNVERIFIED_CONTAM: hypothetical protein PYX00_005359 [Menopon gallinae]|uniref:Uncharacterized protein n=1 Tax=Menopon gallinae TaxID=328185 RepID=A0AAW2HRU7_9NEOP
MLKTGASSSGRSCRSSRSSGEGGRLGGHSFPAGGMGVLQDGMHLPNRRQGTIGILQPADSMSPESGPGRRRGNRR